MVNTFGKDIISAYTGGVPVVEIYNNGVKVWPIGWYIKWTPTDLSGTFTIDGSTYNMEDYNGYFSDFSGVITSSAFRSTGITTIDTNAITIQERAFAACGALSQISLSQCETMGQAAFAGCLFQYIDLPKCQWIGIDAFYYCINLSQVSLPECRAVPIEAFAMCRNLQSIELPKCSYVTAEGFTNCYSLSLVSLPVCKNLIEGCFGKCSSLQYIYLPECENIDRFVFGNCITLPSIDLPVCSNIGSAAFAYCSSLSQITLGSSSVCIMSSDAFNNTPIASGTGSIYVPASLVTAYQSAQNWSQYSSQIYPIQ